MKPKILKRSDVLDTKPVLGQVVRVKEPKFLSLVSKPANQTAFRIVRSDNTGANMPASKKPTVKRLKRSAPVANPVLRLAFPEGTTEEAVTAALTNFGMDGYVISQSDGIFLATRSDVQSIAPEDTEVLLLNEDGLTATIQRSDKQPSSAAPEPGQGIALAAIEFDLSKISTADASAWLQRNSVDISLEENENSTASVVVSRSEVAEGTEVRQMEIEPGVVLSLVRSDADDLPPGVYAAVSETAYGRWGWGQLDFNAALADEVFCDQVRKGIDKLDSVLREILFYSGLPLDVRKQLATTSLSQFNDYIIGFMDMLPRQMLVSLVRSDSTSKEKEVKQTDTAAATEAKPAAAAPAAEMITLSRADLSALIAEEVGKALQAKGTEAAALQRSDATTAAEPAAAAAAPAAAAAAATGEVTNLTRADMTAALAEALQPLAAGLEALRSTTIVRADPGDGNVVQTQQRSDKDASCFDGAIPGIGRRK